jgi:hypothetical protein
MGRCSHIDLFVYRLEERERIDESSVFDVSSGYFNEYEKANEIYQKFIDLSLKEGCERFRLSLVAFDRDSEIFEQQWISCGEFCASMKR